MLKNGYGYDWIVGTWYKRMGCTQTEHYLLMKVQVDGLLRVGCPHFDLSGIPPLGDLVQVAAGGSWAGGFLGLSHVAHLRRSSGRNVPEATEYRHRQ